MKLTHFKIVPFILAGAAFLALSGCDGTTGISSDGGLGGAPVTPPGTAPVAVDDTTTGVTATATTISVVDNDTDVDNDLDVSSVQIVGTANPGDTLVVPGKGSWTVDATGSVTFTPEAGFTGDPVTISYTVSDDTDLVSNEATVTIDYPQTYFENNTTTSLPDWITTTSEITATNAVTTIGKVTVAVNLDNHCVGDLSIRLIAPSMDEIVLAEGINQCHDPINLNITFDDEADVLNSLYSPEVAPFTGSFRPDDPLSTFVGDDANGIWSLVIDDRYEDDPVGAPGILNSWSITIIE